MECINKIELQGIVGSVREIGVGKDRKLYKISLATNHTYKAKDGTSVIETTWHNVNVPDNSINPAEYIPKKGDMIHLLGRIKVVNYQDLTGNLHSDITILTNSCNAVVDNSARV